MQYTIEQSAKQVGLVHALFLCVNNVTCTESTERFLDICNNPDEVCEELTIFNQGFKEIIQITTGESSPSTAGEKLRENFRKNGFKAINNIVDAYNEVSLFYGMGIGGHCISNLDNIHIKVTLASESDEIKPLFKRKYTSVNKGELVYKLNDTTMAWIGSKDVDSDQYKITSTTTQCMFVILGHQYLKYEHLQEVSDRIKRNIALSSDIAPESLKYVEYYVEG